METRENICESKRQYYFKFWSVIKCIYWLEGHFRYMSRNEESDLAPNSEMNWRLGYGLIY